MISQIFYLLHRSNFKILFVVNQSEVTEIAFLFSFRTKRAFSYSPENLKNIAWFTNYVHLWLSQNISYHHNLSAIFERLTCLYLRSYFIFNYIIFNILLFDHKVTKSENQQKCIHRVCLFYAHM